MKLRRLSALFLIAVLALVAGCGGGGDGGGGSDGSLGDMLGYVPKDAPFVVTIKTDPEAYKNADAILGKFPFGGQLKNQLKNELGEQKISYDNDIKPLLGNDLVVAVPNSQQVLQDDAEEAYLVVWTAKDAGKLEETIKKNTPKEIGEVEGFKLYQDEGDDDVTAISDGTIVAAADRATVEAAIKRSGGDDHLTEEDFNKALNGIPNDGLVKIYGNIAPLIAASPEAAAARKVPFVSGLRTFGMNFGIVPNGIELNTSVTTEGVPPEGSPIAGGDESPQLVKREGDFGIAIRDLSHTIQFAQQTAQAASPEEYAQFEAAKKQIAAGLGIDVDKDLFGQLTGATSISIGGDGGVAFRSDLTDASKIEDLLEQLEKTGLGDTKLKSVGGGLYEADDNGTKFYVGVIADKLVGGTDPERAAEMASLQPQTVAGAKGAIVMSADGKALADSLAQNFGGEAGGSASLFTGPIGDILGYVVSNPDGLRQTLRLNFK